MKNKYFNKALFTENLKRFWSVAAIYFGLMYITGIDYLKMNRDDLDFYTVSNILRHEYFWFVFYAVFPIIAAFVVFSYLNTSKSSILLHSMPLTRKSLFITNYITGTVLTVAPLILTMVFLFIFKGPTITGFEMYSYPEVYTTGNILSWFFQAFCINTFTYSLAVFGILCSGNGVIAALTAISANWIMPVVLACLNGFAANAYFGYYDNDSFEKILLASPFGVMINRGTDYYEEYNVYNKQFLIYLIVAYAVSFGAYLLYTKRKIENTEDSYVFKLIEKFIGFLFVFIPCSFCGLILYDYWGFMAYVYGGLIGFVIGQMITRKTFRIINKEGLKNLLIFSVVMVIVVGSFSFDLFGYERSVPSLDEVERIEVSSNFFYNDFTWGGVRYETDNAEEIQAVIDLHKDIIEDEKTVKTFEEHYFDSDFSTGYINIGYVMKDGSSMIREYYLRSDWNASHESFRTVYNNALKNTTALDNLSKLLQYETSATINLWSVLNDSVSDNDSAETISGETSASGSDITITVENLSETEKQEFYQSLQNAYETLNNNMDAVFDSMIGTVEISCKVPAVVYDKYQTQFESIYGFAYREFYEEPEGSSEENDVKVVFNFSIREYFTDTKAWMKEMIEKYI